MKFIITLFILSFVALGNAQLSQVRLDYVKAKDSEVITKQLHDKLSSVSDKDDVALQVYKGAVMTMMAKYTKDRKDKKDYFKGGATLIETILSKHPKHLEGRYIRLSVQDNAPKFLGYHKSKEEDKAFVLDNFKLISNPDIRSTIKTFANNSSFFTSEERSLLN